MNALSFVVLAAVAASASAGLLGAPVQVATGTYSTYGARISQSAHPVSYAPAVQYASPVHHAIAAPVAVPAATYSTSALRISQSAHPVPAYAQAVQYASPVHHAIAAHPAVGVATVGAIPHAIGYGYTPALSTLLG